MMFDLQATAYDLIMHQNWKSLWIVVKAPKTRANHWLIKLKSSDSKEHEKKPGSCEIS